MTTSNPIDIAVGQVLGNLRDTRGEEVEAAASVAGMSLEELRKVIEGSRRLSASEIFALSQRLAVPVAAFYAGVHRTCGGLSPHRDNDD